ncbi:hypothetical protein T11_537 [Trichinella zimbabwensis]|uniref:Secreted protein n=1 Tax=Trichinella zimbabwensis TaxID=268475 RepID=A0A0V1HRQ6_9BILA|nr:hypothetical protein T11_537 [Trichinella zimbabwensis]
MAFSNVTFFFLFLWSTTEHRQKHHSAGQSGEAFLLLRAKRQFPISTKIENQVCTFHQYSAINLFLLHLVQSSPRSDHQGFLESIARRVQIRLYIFKAGPAFICKLCKQSSFPSSNNAQPSMSSRSKCSASLEKPSFSINWRT